MTADDDAATYSTPANPDTYDLLATRRGRTPDHYETWLADSLPACSCLPGLTDQLAE